MWTTKLEPPAENYLWDPYDEANEVCAQGTSLGECGQLPECYWNDEMQICLTTMEPPYEEEEEEGITWDEWDEQNNKCKAIRFSFMCTAVINCGYIDGSCKTTLDTPLAPRD
mmetsp:Transcript_27209/g.43743  ORF Transcript_27209/g.43743 Transcript_27209/m.43743 type:complete len:112 (-) Transcript_27209:2276-2611(-)